MQAISQRVEELTRWLDEKAPNCATTQKHLDEGSVEQASGTTDICALCGMCSRRSGG
jgi:hypothetical protein